MAKNFVPHSGEANPTFGHANANFSVFRNQFSDSEEGRAKWPKVKNKSLV